MKAVLVCVAAIAMTAACAPLDAVPIHPQPMAMSDCTARAMAAVQDAAADTYDAVMQDMVYKNSYQACVQEKAGTSGN